MDLVRCTVRKNRIPNPRLLSTACTRAPSATVHFLYHHFPRTFRLDGSEIPQSDASTSSFYLQIRLLVQYHSTFSHKILRLRPAEGLRRADGFFMLHAYFTHALEAA